MPLEGPIASGCRLGEARIRDGQRVYAIGDIHGCLRELTALHRLIEDDLATSPVENHRIVHVGDYVDRGPDSRQVIDYLIERMACDATVVCLKGNHEDKLETFLKDPEQTARGFFAFGGVETMRSYGVGVALDAPDYGSVSALCRALHELMPEAHQQFLSGLPYSHVIDDYVFVHAGIRPGVPVTDQDGQDLMWIRWDFLNYEGLHEKIVVHGHTPHVEPEVKPNRINVDTMCYGTGRLTAVVLERNCYRFISTQPE